MFGALLMAMVLSASAIAESPVADAAMQGDLTQLKALIEGGADVNAS